MKVIVSYPSFPSTVVVHKTEWTRKKTDLDIYFEESISNYFPISSIMSKHSAYIICVWKLQQGCRKAERKGVSYLEEAV